MNGGLSMVEMKSGYKMTEVGVIPEDWEVCELRNHLVLLTDYDANGSFADMASNVVTTTGNGYAWYVRATDLEQQSSLSEVKYVDEKSYRFLRKSTLYGGEVLLAKRGEIGKVYYFQMKTKRATLAPNLYLLKLKDTINSYFLFSLFKSTFGQNLLKSINASTSLGAIYKDDVKGLNILIPPFEEQASIATALSDVDSLISALTKKIEKKKAIKQGLMQQLLTGKKRLPGYEKNREPVQTEWGAIPKDWKTLSIGKCCSIKARIGWQGLKKSEYLSSGEYVLVTGTDFLNGRIDWKSCVYVSKKRYEQDANIQIVKHDILITKDGTIGKVAFLDDVPCLGTLNSGIFVVRSHSEELDQCYLSKIFESFIFDAFLESLVAGSTINHLYQKDFVHFNFPVPPTMSEQTAIANILSDCDSEIAALEEKRDKYKEIKQGMMQQLLTGKIRLIK